jgi:YVTN family beta-propeller protein
MLRLIPALLVLSLALFAHPAQILILHKGASSLGFYTSKGQHEVSVPTGKHPHEMVLSPDGKFLYCTDNGTMLIEQVSTGGNTISIMDIHSRERSGEISLGKFRRPHGIDLDPKTGLVYVSTELPDQLVVIDPKKREVVKTYDTGGKTAHMVKLGPEGKWAYVSNSSSKTVGAIELATGKVTLIPTGERPEGSALSPDGKLLYVVNREGAQITVIDTTTRSAVGAIKTGNGPVRVGVTPDGGTVVFSLMHDEAMGFADAATRKVTTTIPLGGKPVSLHISPDGRFAFASAQDLQTVYAVSIPERKVVQEIRTADEMFPDAVMVVH